MTLLKSTVQDTVPNEFLALTAKAGAAINDIVLVEDSTDAGVKKALRLAHILVKHDVLVDRVDWSPDAIAVPVALPAADVTRRFVSYSVECIATQYGRMTVAPTRLP